MLLTLLGLLLYNYAYLLSFALSKLISYSLHWFFCGALLVLGIVVVYVFSVRARAAYWTHELVISLVLLFIVLPFYMVVIVLGGSAVLRRCRDRVCISVWQGTA